MYTILKTFLDVSFSGRATSIFFALLKLFIVWIDQGKCLELNLQGNLVKLLEKGHLFDKSLWRINRMEMTRTQQYLCLPLLICSFKTHRRSPPNCCLYICTYWTLHAMRCSAIVCLFLVLPTIALRILFPPNCFPSSCFSALSSHHRSSTWVFRCSRHSVWLGVWT